MPVDPRTGEIIRQQPQPQRTERSSRSIPFDPDRFWDFLCSPVLVFWVTLGIFIFVYVHSGDNEHKLINLFGENYVQSNKLPIEKLQTSWNNFYFLALISFSFYLILYLIEFIKIAVLNKLLNPLKANHRLLLTLTIWFRSEDSVGRLIVLFIPISDFCVLFFFFQNWINNGEPNIWLRWCVALSPVILSFCLVLEAFGIISKLYRFITDKN